MVICLHLIYGLAVLRFTPGKRNCTEILRMMVVEAWVVVDQFFKYRRVL